MLQEASSRDRVRTRRRSCRGDSEGPPLSADLSACVRKDFVLGARVERMRPGRMPKSSFPIIVSAARCKLLSKHGAMTKMASCAGLSQCSKHA